MRRAKTWACSPPKSSSSTIVLRTRGPKRRRHETSSASIPPKSSPPPGPANGRLRTQASLSNFSDFAPGDGKSPAQPGAEPDQSCDPPSCAGKRISVRTRRFLPQGLPIPPPGALDSARNRRLNNLDAVLRRTRVLANGYLRHVWAERNHLAFSCPLY
jgi:hypothetical protein